MNSDVHVVRLTRNIRGRISGARRDIWHRPTTSLPDAV